MMPLTDTPTSSQPVIRRRRRRRRYPPRWLRLTISLTVLGALAWGLLKLGQSTLSVIWPAGSAPAPVSAGDWTHTLVVAIDPRQLPLNPLDKVSHRLADGFFVLGQSNRLKQAFMLAIPRETRAALGEAGTGTLGDGMAVGDLRLVSNTIEELTGLTLHHRATIDLSGARALLPSVSPNDIFFSKPFRYQAPEYQLNIDVGDGWQSLDAERSLAYLFARGKEPTERLERIQALLHEWHQRLRHQWAWPVWRFKGLVNEVVPHDFERAELDQLWTAIIQTDTAAVAYATLPGSPSPQGEWLFNPTRWESLKSRLQAPLSASSGTDGKTSVAISYEDPGDERVMLLANALSARGFQVIRTAREAVNQNDVQLIENPQVKQRSAAIITTLTESLGGEPRIVLASDVTDSYGAQYRLRLGKRFFR